MEETKETTTQDIERFCASEIEEVLKKYNCALHVAFQQEIVLGQPVLKYNIQIAHKK